MKPIKRVFLKDSFVAQGNRKPKGMNRKMFSRTS